MTLPTPPSYTPEQFQLTFRAMRDNGWPLSTLSKAFNLTPQILKQWDETPLPANHPPLPDVPPYTSSRPELTATQQEELRTLSKTARSNRGRSAENSPQRLASNKLGELLVYYRDSGYSISSLARACDVNRRAIYQRLERV